LTCILISIFARNPSEHRRNAAQAAALENARAGKALAERAWPFVCV